MAEGASLTPRQIPGVVNYNAKVRGHRNSCRSCMSGVLQKAYPFRHCLCCFGALGVVVGFILFIGAPLGGMLLQYKYEMALKNATNPDNPSSTKDLPQKEDGPQSKIPSLIGLGVFCVFAAFACLMLSHFSKVWKKREQNTVAYEGGYVHPQVPPPPPTN